MGHEGVLGVLSSESISTHIQGLQTPVQLPATTCSAQIWISGSTPFWCKNHFCSLKTEGVIKYFLTKNIFPMTPCLVKALLHCALCTGPWQWQGTGSVSRWSCRQCIGTILPWPPRLSPPLLWLVSNAGPAPVLAPVLRWPQCCRTLQVL